MENLNYIYHLTVPTSDEKIWLETLPHPQASLYTVYKDPKHLCSVQGLVPTDAAQGKE
jgi:hypothetical protein